MRQVGLRKMGGHGSIDLCDRCGGVFLEFFDGEPGSLSREIRQHLSRFESPLKVGGDPFACPDCNRVMEVHPYLDEGPNIARCNRCMAVFATPEQVRALADFHFIQDAPSWFERLVALLRSIFFGP
jgi:Zn-finger nucleic acid-binding protein